METSAAAAQCHYQARRFSQAFIELEKCDTLWDRSNYKIVTQDVHKTNYHNDEDDNIIMANDIKPIVPNKISGTNSTTRIELIALPPLARRADIAMCRFFRSAISSSVGNIVEVHEHDDGIPKHTKSEKSLFNLWMNALEANANYRQALKGAATSLVHTCNMELQSNKTSHTNNNTNNSNHTTIQKAMKSTSMAILMAGIAASHLYLYHTESTTQNKTTHSENTWSVLVDTAISSANLMRTRKDWMNKLE